MVLSEPQFPDHRTCQGGYRYQYGETGDPDPVGTHSEIQSDQGVFRIPSEMGREGPYPKIGLLRTDL